MNSIAIFQRWSSRRRPREHILNFLALASKVKYLALASKPTSPRKCPVCGRGQRTIFWFVKMGQGYDLFVFLRLGERVRDLTVNLLRRFFWKTLARCVLGHWAWPQAFLSLAYRGSVLGIALFCVLGLCLEPCVFDSTSAIISLNIHVNG